MKKNQFLLTLCAMIAMVAGSWAQDAPQEEAKADKAEVTATSDAEGQVVDQLKKATFISGTPNTSAHYYIILYSASWCGPCNMEAPKVVDLYNNQITADADVELIMANCDHSADAATAWAKKMGMKFPILTEEEWQKIDVIAQNAPRGIPTAVLVDAQGKVLVPKARPTGCFDYYVRACKNEAK
jgi:thiol-disulfide isomerase/thioredoxin